MTTPSESRPHSTSCRCKGSGVIATTDGEAMDCEQAQGVKCFACGGIVGTHLAPYGVRVLDTHPALFTDGFDDCEGSNRAPR